MTSSDYKSNKDLTIEQLSKKVNQIVTKYLDHNTIYIYDNPMPDKGINHLVFSDIISDIENEFNIPLQDIYNNNDQDFYSLKTLSLITNNIKEYLCDALNIN